MKRILPIILCLCLLLAGCGKNEEIPEKPVEQPTATPTAAPTTEPEPTTEPPVIEPATEPTEAPTTAPTEPELLYQHPLTGEPLAEPMTNQPVAVIINNIRHAQPLHGVGQADVICEIVAEGGGSITRLLAIYTDLANVEKVGSIRSARTYMVDLARAFGEAPLVHCGYSDYARQDINRTKHPTLNQSFHAEYFYRDQARKNAGYAQEHTLFATGEKLIQGLTDKGYDLVVEEGVDFGLQFAQQVALNGQPANKISFRFYSEGGKETVLTYDEASDVYFATQIWKTRTEKVYDANTKEDVPFRNALLLYSKTTSDGYRMFADLTGEGTGYFACGGQIVPIKWFRESEKDPFTYTLEDGTPITLAIGKTYIGIIPTRYPEITIE